MTATASRPAPLDAAPTGRTARRVGYALTGLVTLFLLFDAVTKLLRLQMVVDATVQMGFPAWTVPVIGGT